MRDHFARASAACDAVISGRLEDVRTSLLAIANSPPREDVPHDWLPWLDEMRVTAQRGAQSTTLDQAAASVAGLANDCGECHRATRGGQHDAARQPNDYDPKDKKGLAEKMARHKFAAEALWLGLTGPEHQAWVEGVAALMNINVPGLVNEHGTTATTDRRASGEGSLQGSADPRLAPQGQAAATSPAQPGSVDLDVALKQLRALGTQADQAKTADEKQAVFGQLITRCGNCHAKLGINVAATPVAPALATAAHKRVEISADKIVITEKIQFDFDAATIKPESHALLDEIANVIKANPRLRKISIEGHTDSDGVAAYNLKLSRERATSVQRYLTGHGVAAERLSSTGFGAEKPIANNDTLEGKEQNRRVEFLIVEQDPLKETYVIDPKTGKNRPVENPSH
jgi:outer membrane protein OmpA-like peptidoglycan-associated protein